MVRPLNFGTIVAYVLCHGFRDERLNETADMVRQHLADVSFFYEHYIRRT